MNEIAPIVTEAPAAMSAAEPALAGSLINVVARAMTDPSVNVDKLEGLLRIQREIVANETALRFNRAMSACQAEMRPVVRNMPNSQTNSRYADLAAIDAAISPIYTRHGFSLEFDSERCEGTDIIIVCEVSHEAGHSKFRRLTAPLDTVGPNGKPNKTPLHGLGSTVSYLRRYLTCMVFNVTLAAEDTDGNRAPAPSQHGLISHAQVMDLKGLMRDTHTLESRFLAVMCPHLTAITQVPAADVPRLRNALLTKKSVLAQRAANQGDRP